MEEPYPVLTHVSWAGGLQTGEVIQSGKRPGEDTWSYYLSNDDAGALWKPSADLTVIT